MFYLAELETTNFTFTAYAETKLEALQILQSTFEDHIKRHHGFLTWEDVAGDVFVISRNLGKGYVN
jgi:hypothetical protein